MAPPKWTLPEQEVFLIAENEKWSSIKAGSSLLKNFYTRTAITFLEKWPAVPTAEQLKEAKGEPVEAKRLAEVQLHTVSVALALRKYFFLFVWQRVATWFNQRHRPKKSNPPTSESVLDLSGKNSRKRPAMQRWQAFSAIYYRPEDSPLRGEVQSLFERRGDSTAVAFLASLLLPNATFNNLEYLTFLSMYLRERCTRLSDDEEQKVEAYIKEQGLLAEEHRDRPWFLDENFQDKPLAAENKYIQE